MFRKFPAIRKSQRWQFASAIIVNLSSKTNWYFLYHKSYFRVFSLVSKPQPPQQAKRALDRGLGPSASWATLLIDVTFDNARRRMEIGLPSCQVPLNFLDNARENRRRGHEWLDLICISPHLHANLGPAVIGYAVADKYIYILIDFSTYNWFDEAKIKIAPGDKLYVLTDHWFAFFYEI